MLAKIYDDRGRWIKNINGEFKDNLIHYHIGGFNVFGRWFFSKEKTIGCDYGRTLQDKKGKVAYYEQNGLEYIQMQWKDMPGGNATSNQVLKDAKTADYVIDNSLTHPKSNIHLIETGIAIILLVATILLLQSSSQNAQAIAASSASSNHTTQITNNVIRANTNADNGLNNTMTALLTCLQTKVCS